MISWQLRLVTVVGWAAITALLYLNFCDLMYQCGCTWMWAGAADHCNIHTPGAKHCPFCTVGLAPSIAIFAAILAAEAAVAFGWRTRSRWKLIAATGAAFPIAGGLIAVALGIQRGYWS